MSVAKVVPLTADGTAVLVTDADPEDALLISNAWKVLKHARRMLDAHGELTVAELRFVAENVSHSLGDMLDMTE